MVFTIPDDGDVPTYGPNSPLAAPDSRDFDIIVASANDGGVITGCAVTAQGSPNMTVAVATGLVEANRVWGSVTAGNVTITTANGSNPRFDLIVASNAGVLSAVAGTAAATPVFPAIPANSVVLASVYVPTSVTSITSNQIVDKRITVPATPPAGEQPATSLPLTTVTRAGSGWSLPINSLRAGTHLRINVALTNTGTIQTLTPTLKYGTANTNADADQIGSTALAAGTGVVGSALCVYDFMVLTSTTAMSSLKVYNGIAGITGLTSVAFTSRGSAGPITIATTTANFLAPYFSDTVNAIVTVRSIDYEIVNW